MKEKSSENQVFKLAGLVHIPLYEQNSQQYPWRGSRLGTSILALVWHFSSLALSPSVALFFLQATSFSLPALLSLVAPFSLAIDFLVLLAKDPLVPCSKTFSSLVSSSFDEFGKLIGSRFLDPRLAGNSIRLLSASKLSD